MFEIIKVRVGKEEIEMLNAKEMLIDFASDNGIDESRVDEYVAKFSEFNTFQEVYRAPEGLLEHDCHASNDLGETLNDLYEPPRYERVPLADFYDDFLSRINSIFGYDVGAENLTVEELRDLYDPDSEGKEGTDELGSIVNAMIYVINYRIGSCIFDW